jgi:hypothetical protein
MSTDRTLTIPERLQKIIEIFKRYHGEIVQRYTLDNKDPADLKELPKILKEFGSTIYDYLRSEEKYRNSYENSKENSYSVQCIKELGPYIRPWNQKVSTLAPEWCSKIFLEYTIITPAQIDIIYNESDAKDIPPVDGVSPRNDI